MTKTQEKEISYSSARFFCHLTGETSAAHLSGNLREIYHLIETAFRQYKLEWMDKNLAKWVWPYHVVNGDFEGNQPWSVCLREAYRLTKELKTDSMFSMYRGKTKFNREQLVFVVETILIGALDIVEGMLPTSVSYEERALVQPDTADMSEWERGAVATAGMSLSIFAAQLLNDGIGSSDALIAAGDFPARIESLVRESWKDEGAAVHAKCVGQFNIKDVLPGYPDCRVLAEEFVGKIFSDYLK